ncbi:MAG TPA: molybdopterin cofactor-binding domain-containing protein [Bryobacteraceae bacterium]|nr:molybdopterin cofactor-binding domain-containing protein [Bryobacteraceae bacterium]
MVSRREFLATGGALIVSFSSARAQGPFDTHASHIDPKQLDSWLAVAADGAVTAHTGKVDLGQGMFTAQTQLVAEELCVPVARVKLIQGDTDVTPDQGTTSGSQSSPTNFREENLALAAATAREALVNMAAAQWKIPAGQLSVADGVITGPGNRRAAYAQLIGGQQFHLTLSSTAKRRPRDQWKVLGKSVPALDRTALMTGRFEYVQYVKVPGMLHGRVVRPPQMGGTVASVDRDSVGNIPGVQVVVRKDFVGVVAPTQYDATRAAKQLKVNWNPAPELPAQNTFYDYLQKQPSQDQLLIDSGSVEPALASAGNVIRAKYLWPYQMHGSLGASCAVADVRGAKVTVWSPTQSPYPTRSCIAKILNVPLENVHVIFTRGSGCYGLNGADAVSFDAAVLSQAVGKPVRLQFSREDEMRWENLGAAVVVEQRAALGPDGAILAWDRENWESSLGSRPGYDTPGNVISGMLLGYEPRKPHPAPARPPQGRLRNGSNTVPGYMAGCIGDVCAGDGAIRHERVLTHQIVSPFFTGPLRSPLRIQNTFANECFMDELAAAAKADPVEFRLKHLKDPRLIAVLQSAAKAANWQTRPAGQGKGTGRGVACVNYEGGNGYAAMVADVEVNRQTGEIRPKRFVVAIDAGAVSNPDGLRNQAEGGVLQGMSRALVEEVKWDSRHITSTDWVSYPVLYLGYEMPEVEVVIVEPPEAPATGAGETAITIAAPAIANAVFDATGARLRQVPFTPERLKPLL